MAEDPETPRWWKETDPCQSPLPDAAAKGRIWSDTKEVYFFDDVQDRNRTEMRAFSIHDYKFVHSPLTVLQFSSAKNIEHPWPAITRGQGGDRFDGAGSSLIAVNRGLKPDSFDSRKICLFGA